MSNLHWLHQIRPSHRQRVGNKAFQLSHLLQRGYPIVPGFVVAAQAFRDFLAVIDWSEPMLADLPNSSLHLDIENAQQLRAIAQTIRQAIATAEFPSELQAQLEAATQQLQTPAVMLRPSLMVYSDMESGGAFSQNAVADFKSSALFDTQICQATGADVAAGLKQLWAELFGAKSLFYWQRQGILLQQVHLAVLVQPVWPAVASGTVRVDGNSFTIQATTGLGMPLAWGEVIPDFYQVERATGTVETQRLGNKTIAYQLMTSPPISLHHSTSSTLTPAPTLQSLLEPSDSLQLVEKAPLTFCSPLPALHNRPVPLCSYWLSEEQQQRFALEDASLNLLIHLVQQVAGDMGEALELEWLECSKDPSQPELYLTQATTWLPATSQATWREATGGSRTPLPFARSLPSPSAENEELFWDSILVSGLAAAPGQAIARAIVITHPGELVDPIPPGRVLVASVISPDWLPLIRQAAGIVAEQGGMTSHSAIVARELGIPAVLAATNATRCIQTDEWVLVDGSQGRVYQAAEMDVPAVTPLVATEFQPPSAVRPPIGTQLMVNLSQPDSLEQVAALPVDGVGLLRSELLMLTVFDQHPAQWLAPDGGEEFVEKLAAQLCRFAQVLLPRPVFYRSLDLRAHEFQRFLGNELTPVEANPMLGLRGTFSYLLEPTLFRLELAALAQVQRLGYANMHLLLPFVRTVEEFQFCRQQVVAAGLFQQPQFQLWIMAEVPSVLFLLPEYVKAGVQGISIGTNDLTQLLLGVDRDQGPMATAFDERHPAVVAAIAQLVQEAKHHGIPCSICGQAPVQYPDLIDHLIRWGITSISVTPEAVESTYWAIARAERRLLLEVARQTL